MQGFTSAPTCSLCLVFFSVCCLFLSLPLLPQAPDKHGFTPLMSACFEGHVSCVKLLLEKVGTVIWAFIHVCTKKCTGVFHPLVHADVSEVPCEPCECWWGNSLDKKPFNAFLWRLCWNVHRASHTIAVVHLLFLCLCFWALSFIGAQHFASVKSLLHPSTSASLRCFSSWTILNCYFS